MLRNSDFEPMEGGQLSPPKFYRELDRGYEESLRGSEGVTPEGEDDMQEAARDEQWIEEERIKRQMDYGEPQGCHVRVVGSGASGVATEYTSYDLNRRLAWARLVTDEVLQTWLYSNELDEFDVPAIVCPRCNENMNRGLWYNDTWAISVCPQCDTVAWVQPKRSVHEHGVQQPPFDFAITQMFSGLSPKKTPEPVKKKSEPTPYLNDNRSVPGGKAMKYEPEHVVRTRSMVKQVQEILGVPADGIMGPQTLSALRTLGVNSISLAQMMGEDMKYARLKVENHFDDHEARNFVDALQIVHDYIVWALKCFKDGDNARVEELLGGLAFGLGDFITQSDVNKLAMWNITLGPSLPRVTRGGGDAGLEKKYQQRKLDAEADLRSDVEPEGKVRWDMSVAHIQTSMDKLTAAANIIEGILETVIRRGGNANDLEKVERIVQTVRRPFDSPPEETVGRGRDFPRGTVKPTREALWAMARLGMLVFDADQPLDRMRVGDYVQFKRRSAGLSVREVAGKASMPIDKYTRIEERQQMPTRSDVGRICSVIPGASAKFALGLKGVA